MTAVSTIDSPAILLVDDVEIILRSLERLLKRENYRVFLALSGREALEILQKQEIALIISDHSMPGMSGIELLEQVHETYPDIVRVLLTANAEFKVASGAINRGGVYRFLTKPVDYAEFLQTVRLALTYHAINTKLSRMPAFLSQILSGDDEQLICDKVEQFLSIPAVVCEMHSSLKLFDNTPLFSEKILGNIQNFMPVLTTHRSVFSKFGFRFDDHFTYHATGVYCEQRLRGILVMSFTNQADAIWQFDDSLKQTRNHLITTVADMLGLVLSNLRLKNELHRQSIIDELTGIYNRRHFEHRLTQEKSRAERYNNPLSLIIFDVDKFKLINDRYGHLTGDVVLRRIGYALRHIFRKSDVLCRYGGDEFVILLPQARLEEACEKAESLRSFIESNEIETETDTLSTHLPLVAKKP